MARQLDVQYVSYYTAGSSALKLAPAIPLETLQLPRKSKRKAKRFVLCIDPVAYAGIAMAAIMTVLMIVGFVQFNSLRQEQIAMAAYVESLQQENEKLTAEFEAGYDLERVEEVALALGMVPEEQLQKVTISVTEPVQESEPSGWQTFWASVIDLFA